MLTPPYRFMDAMRECGSPIELPFLRTVLLGSAPVTVSFLEKLEKFSFFRHAQVIALYGATEILPIASIDAKEKIERKHEFPGDVLGYPFPDIDCAIEHDSELVIRSGRQFLRYLGGEAPQRDS